MSSEAQQTNLVLSGKIHPHTLDRVYYKVDGDCVVLIHCFLFNRDTSSLATRFRLPSNALSPGIPVMHPIVLHEDIEDFRALCWVLYAFPHEITAQSDVQSVDIPRLISLVRICRKYQFNTIQKWALDLLSTHLDPQTPCYFLRNCSVYLLAQTLELSVLCNVEALQDYVEAQWLKRIREGQLAATEALAVAERLGLREFQGQLYYAQLVQLSTRFLHPSSDGGAGGLDIQRAISNLHMTENQQRNLYAGFWSLSFSWLKFISIAGSIISDHQLPCGSSLSCGKEWNSAWQNSLAATYFNEAQVDYVATLDDIMMVLGEDPDCNTPFSRIQIQTTGSAPASAAMASQDMQSSSVDPIIDPNYYKPTGDCIFLVGVHRFLLTQDSSMFETMFSLPNNEEGTSVTNPVTLQDNIEDFRALCWILYALPNEITAQSDVNHVNISKLMSLFRISKKYEFLTIGQWALDHLNTHLDPQSPCLFLQNGSLEDLTKVLEISILGDAKGLQEYVETRWVARIAVGSNGLSIPEALAVAERLGLRGFQGRLYYRQLVELSEVSLRLELTAGDPNLLNGIHNKLAGLPLTQDQKIKLYTGYWLLSHSWMKFTNTISRIVSDHQVSGQPSGTTSDLFPAFQHTTSHHRNSGPWSYKYSTPPTPAQSTCGQNWKTAWQNCLSTVQLNYTTVDYVEYLGRAMAALRKDSNYIQICESCHEGVWKALSEEKEKMEEKVCNYFLGTERA
ncbi:hypothetical protein AX16_004591 [Volvariella volvacea WC 439]|nr:hypothetical protein AX16_004591 [Volvariella volvacea WC 439]